MYKKKEMEYTGVKKVLKNYNNVTIFILKTLLEIILLIILKIL